MCTSRLRARVPSCEFVTTARLPEYKLCFHKRSSDQSSKCNAFETGSDSDAIWGVVFNIPPSEKRRLDRAEGLGNGYNEKTIDVITPSGDHVAAITYYADKIAIAEGLPPYSWYKELVLNVAKEHGLSSGYIASSIEAVTAIKDPDGSRDERHRFN